jgi:TolA-binding protein
MCGLGPVPFYRLQLGMSILEQHQKKEPVKRHLGGAVIGLCCLLLCFPIAALGERNAEDDFALCRTPFRDGDWDLAARKFTDFIRNYPTDARLPEARLMLARSHSRGARCDEAVGAYAGFYERHPEHLSAADARRERAGCLSQLGQFLPAAVALEEVQRLFSQNTFAPDALLEAASNYRLAENFGEAARVYRRVITEYSTHVTALTARYLLAQLRFAQGDSGEALRLLGQIDETASESEQARDALLLSQRILLALNQGARASQTMKHLVKRFADSAHADSALVDFARYHFAQKRFDEAVAAYSEAAKRRSTSVDWINLVHLGLADALRESEQFERAVEMYKKVTSQSAAASGTLALANVGLATTYSRTGRARKAVPIFLRLVQRNSPAAAAASPVSRLVWAMAVRELASLYWHQGDYTRASVRYDHYLSEADRQGAAFPEVKQVDWVRLQLAKLYDSAGQSARAIQLFESLRNAAMHLQPDIQRSLAAAFEGAGETNRALDEYRLFLERFPDHNYARRVRERIELLSEFTIRDQGAYGRAVNQASIDNLNGRSRRSLLFDLAITLHQHQDFDNAVNTFETYVASYPDDPDVARAQFLLAECLLSLARKRELENAHVKADSLRQLGLEEHRILAAKDSPFSRRAQLRLIEVGALAAPDSTRLQILQSGLISFLSDSESSAIVESDIAIDTRGQALLLLGDTQRRRGTDDEASLTAALATYGQLLQLVADDQGLAVRARFGRAQCLAQLGHNGVVDSLQVLGQQAGALVPDILFELGHALIRTGEPRQAISRFSELLEAYPAYPQRRKVLEVLAATYFQVEEYRLAVSQYQRLLNSATRPERVADLQQRLAESYHAAGYSIEALNLYTAMLGEAGQAPGADSLAFSRGSLLLELGQLEEAEKAFDDLQRDFPSSTLATQARVESADLLFELKRYKEASAAYAPLLKGSATQRLVGHAVVSLYRLNRLKDGRKLSKRVDDVLWQVLVQLEEGRLHMRGGEHEQAQKLFAKIEQNCREKPPRVEDFSEPDADLASMAAVPAAAAGYYLVTSKWEQNLREPSEEGLRQSIDAQQRFLKDYGDTPLAVDVLLRVGHFNFEVLQVYLMAAGNFRRVLDSPYASTEKKHDAIWMLLQSYEKSNEYDDAQRIAARLLDDFSDHPRAKETQLQIGLLLIDQGQHAQAIGHLRNVLTWAQGEAATEARFYIGSAYQNMREYSKAIEAYNEVRFYGTGASANWITSADYQRAQCYEVLKQYSLAKSMYEEIIRREGGDSPFGIEARKQLDRLEGLLVPDR